MNKTYAEQWNEYRKRRNTVLIIGGAYLPGVSLFVLLLGNLFRSDAVIPIVAFTWLLAFAVSAARASTWNCPRCGKWYHAKWFGTNPLTDSCLHCRLPKWADSDTRRPDELKYGEFLCFECGHIISKSDLTCANCGWSWQEKNAQQDAPVDS